MAAGLLTRRMASARTSGDRSSSQGVKSVVSARLRIASARTAAGAPAKVYNVGNNHPEELTHVVAVLEQELGRPAVREMLPMQPGDVTETFADVAELMRDMGFP